VKPKRRSHIVYKSTATATKTAPRIPVPAALTWPAPLAVETVTEGREVAMVGVRTGTFVVVAVIETGVTTATDVVVATDTESDVRTTGVVTEREEVAARREELVDEMEEVVSEVATEVATDPLPVRVSAPTFAPAALHPWLYSAEKSSLFVLDKESWTYD
jgi:hypothetical protein